MYLRRIVLALVLGLLLLAAAGCPTRTPLADPSTPTGQSLGPPGPSDAGTPTQPGDTAPSAQPSLVTTNPPNGAPPGSGPGSGPGNPAPPRVPSQGDLQRALLTASDLTGFTVDSSNSDAHPGASGGCAALDSDFSSGASATAEVLLTQGATGPYLRERLRQLPVSGAAAAFAQVSSAVTTCHTFTVTDPTLGTLALTVGHLEVSTYGDATVGLRVTIKPERFPAVTLYENIVAVRVGGTFMLITHTAVNGISDELTRAATSKAHAKMRAAW